MTRNKALIIVVPLVLILAMAVLLPLLLDKDKILELATEAIREQTGATLTVGGAAELDLFPRPGVSLAEVSLTMPGEEQAGLQIRALQIGMQLVPLFSGRVEIDSLSLDGLTSRIPAAEEAEQVDTANMSDAELDAYYASRRKSQAEAGVAAGSEAALAVPLALNVQTLTVTDSRLEMLAADGTPASTVELRRLEASDLNLEARPIGLQAEIRLPGEQTIELDLEATVRIDQQQQLVTIESIEVTIAGATARPIELQASGEADINRQSADLDVTIAMADLRGEGSLGYANFESPRIDADLHFNQFDPAVLALAGPEAADEEAHSAEGAAGGDDPLPLATLRGIDTRARLSIDSALLAGHEVQNLLLAMRAVDGLVQVNSLTGDVHGGKLTLEAIFNGKHNTATLKTSGQLTGMDISTALTATGSDPIASGKANLDWQLDSRGRTSNELVGALSGPIKLATAEVVLQEIGVERLLCEAVALTNQEALTASFPASTRFQTLGATIQLADGIARLQPLRAELSYIKLTGTGSYKLLSGDFDTTFNARLSPELETLDRACRVSKRLTAIDWPVDCAGNSAGDPAKWCKVDTAEIIQDLTVNEAQRKIEKKAGKLLEKLFN